MHLRRCIFLVGQSSGETMSMNLKKRKSISLSSEEHSTPKRIKREECNVSNITSALTDLKEEQQIEIRNFLLKKFPIHCAKCEPWATRIFYQAHESGETRLQYEKRLEFLLELISNTVMTDADIYSNLCSVTAPKGAISLTSRLMHALIPWIQATHFFLARGEDLQSKCIIEELNIDGTRIYVPSYKTFAHETDEYANEFMDREDYEFFRDHCHAWDPKKLKELLESPGLITGDEDDFTLNIGVINRCTQKFAIVSLVFLRLSL